MADVDETSVAASLTSDMPIIRKNIDVAQEGAQEAGERAPAERAIETGTSPTQERSNNSHQHDSEYDTASDLEGAEEYDDDDDESLSDEEEYDESDGDDEHLEGDEGISLEKADGDATKKVDEDRSNPQYIPKRGTFYEHDDRESATGKATPAANIVKTTPVPAAQAPKPKKWQTIGGAAGGGGDRWSHDRFEPTEQAPKSRSELVSSYGYDIRTEEAPPRARRRRRYARGPSKYQRNWEDENAYMRANNKERKPPQVSDFLALNERVQKSRKPVNSRLQRSPRSEEQEINRVERRPNNNNNNTNNNRYSEGDYRERDNKTSGPRSGRYGRSNAGATGGRQVPMEFKSKQRRNQYQTSPVASRHNNNNRSPDSFQHDRQSRQNNNTFTSSVNDGQKPKQQQQPQQQFSNNMGQQKQIKQHSQSFGNSDNNYSTNSNNNSNIFHDENSSRTQQKSPPQQQQQQQQPPLQQQNVVRSQNQPQNQAGKTIITASNLQQRLQQVQNRNDPSHVGSVQMHALAAQNQMQANQQHVQQQQQAATNIIIQQQQQQPPPQQQQPQQQPQQQLGTQEQQQQRGPPKRYSSLRRSQHDAHLSDHQLQQLQQQQQQQQNSMMLPPEQQHMLAQANLMQQLYHQENLQAQMQALQVSQQASPAVVKPPPTAYSTVPGATAPTPQVYAASSASGPTVPGTAYYVSAPLPQPPEVTSYTAQPAPPTNFLPQAYGTPAAPPVGPAVAGTTVSGAPAQANANANQNFGNYQNYNTVGGTTYFVPPVQAKARPTALPQRRPTNAIPILPPDNSEKNKQQSRSASETKDDVTQMGNTIASIGSAENIDHILDNMFVQRPVFQPPRKSVSPPPIAMTDAEQPAEVMSASNKIKELQKDNDNATTLEFLSSHMIADENVNVEEKNSTENTPPSLGAAVSTAVTTDQP